MKSPGCMGGRIDGCGGNRDGKRSSRTRFHSLVVSPWRLSTQGGRGKQGTAWEGRAAHGGSNEERKKNCCEARREKHEQKRARRKSRESNEARGVGLCVDRDAKLANREQRRRTHFSLRSAV